MSNLAERMPFVLRAIDELSSLPQQLAEHAARLDEVADHYLAEHRSVSVSTARLGAARAVLQATADPTLGSPTALQLNRRARLLNDEHRTLLGRDLRGMTAWAESWERFQIALVLGLHDVLDGRETCIASRMLLWSPPARSSS